MSTPQFSQRSQSIPGALSIYINDLVYKLKRNGNDITTLSLGEAFFDIPMFDFAKLDFVRGYHYSDSQGLPELREKIAMFYKQQYDANVNGTDEILVTAGSKAAIYMAILGTVNRGEQVLIHEPAWLSYQEQVRLVDAVPSFIPYNVPVSEFESWFTPTTRMLVINNPNNPAGRIYTSEELKELIKLCKKFKAWLLVDEAYSDFINPGEFHSILKFDEAKEVAIVANSLSKNMGMSGWRIGYIVGAPSLIRQLVKLNQHLITCAPTILQAYLAHYFDKIISITLPQAREVVAKRKRVEALVKEVGLSCLEGSATFYFFVSMGDFPANSLDFSMYLLLYHNISTAPGLAYGESTDRFIRVSIGTESEERIADALAVIKNVLSSRDDVKKLVEIKLVELGFRPFEVRHV
ncbi:MAG: pyridoxal phosphate-dependent aminotransferase [Bacteriovorax sp.]|nr:pyridoxal phosphate-dependent aminotransferase [Bacteriovorax sp.]